MRTGLRGLRVAWNLRAHMGNSTRVPKQPLLPAWSRATCHAGPKASCTCDTYLGYCRQLQCMFINNSPPLLKFEKSSPDCSATNGLAGNEGLRHKPLLQSPLHLLQIQTLGLSRTSSTFWRSPTVQAMTLRSCISVDHGRAASAHPRLIFGQPAAWNTIST